MRQKWVILLDSLDLIQAQNCQVDLTHALALALYAFSFLGNMWGVLRKLSPGAE